MTILNIYPDTEKTITPKIADSLLAEIAERLNLFSNTGEEHKIDLRSLPMADADLKDLDDRLGIGEVRADLAVIGKSEVWETAYAGVWRIKHFGTNEIIAVNEVVIAAAPDILFSHRDDARAAAARLDADLATATMGDRELPEEEDPAYV